MYVVTKGTKAVEVLLFTAYVLWVHMQGLTSLGYNQYTRILFIPASMYPDCGPIFGENWKTTKPSPGMSMLLSEEPQGMEVLPLIEHDIYVHGKSLTSMKHNQHTGIPFTQATEQPSCDTIFY